MYGLIVIDVCESNLACCDELFALEMEFPEVSILESMCMSHCDTCAKSPYVFFNGDLVAAPTVQALLDEIKSRIRGILSSYSTET